MPPSDEGLDYRSCSSRFIRGWMEPVKWHILESSVFPRLTSMGYEWHRELERLALSDTVWRCMDFAKLVAMLLNERLYLTRMDRFDDKFEGFFPSPPERGCVGLFADRDNRRYRPEKAKDKKRFYYANCWHISDIESYAMWKVYVAPGNPKWFTSIVESVMRTYGIEADVVQSDLDSEPL